jgi:hypothetical protein
MTELKAEIELRRSQLARHPFLRGLEASSSLDEVRAFLPQLYFFVLSFQDVLRLAHETMTDAGLREIARRHHAEDAGHDQWFAHDMVQLGCERDLSWVFGPEHRLTRDVSYRLIAELLRARDDRVRWTLPLVLEAGASVFFVRMIDLLARAGFQRPLLYFSHHHQQAEAEHDVSTEAGTRALDQISFEPAVYEEALGLVHRSFDLLEQLAAHFESHRVSTSP